MREILFLGVGGQGVVLASRVLGNYYSTRGLNIRTTETIGMAQMGGSVASHLRVSDKEIYSPFVVDGRADIIFAFEPGEVMKGLRFAGPKTQFLIYDQEIEPSNELVSGLKYDREGARAYLGENYNNIHYCNFEPIFETLKNKKVLNICLIGYGSGLGLIDLDQDMIIETIRENISPKYVDLNCQAYKIAQEEGKKHRRENE